MSEVSIPTAQGFRRKTRTYDEGNSNLPQILDALTALLPPAGTLAPSASDVEPSTGWKLCNGQELVKAEFPTLYSIFRGTFGETGTTFNLPDLRGRMMMGSGASYAPALLGTAGQSEIALAIANLPAHGHSITDPGHGHTFTPTPHNHTASAPDHAHTGGAQASANQAITGVDHTIMEAASTDSASISVTVDNASAGGTVESATTGITLGETGSGEAVETLPPVFGINWLVRT